MKEDNPLYKMKTPRKLIKMHIKLQNNVAYAKFMRLLAVVGLQGIGNGIKCIVAIVFPCGGLQEDHVQGNYLKYGLSTDVPQTIY